jgi:2-octaprenyl-6-methoxyphenol hydroxylase
MARDIGMGAINATPRLRRTFIREAAGLTGDLPALMR